MDSYIGNRPINEVAGHRREFIATAGQTTFVVSYAVGFVDVFVNGLKLGADDFTATDGASVVLASPAEADDLVAFIAWAKGTMVPVDEIKPSIVTMPEQAASGTNINFTGIPDWVSRIHVMFSGVSSNGNANHLVQLGTAGGIVNTGYVSACQQYPTVATSNNGFLASGAMVGELIMTGTMVLSKVASNKWQATVVNHGATGNMQIGSGAVVINGTVDRVRVTTVGGTQAYDAGTIGVMYE